MYAYKVKYLLVNTDLNNWRLVTDISAVKGFIRIFFFFYKKIWFVPWEKKH